MRALVTGCAGFIGSHLVDKLLRIGYEVQGIDCFTDYYPREIKEANIAYALHSPKFRLISRDILEISENDIPNVDYVFHLAAQAGVRASWGKDFRIYTRNNIEATQRLLEFYRDKEIKKFVYASSSSVYGRVKLPMREDSLLKPESPYGVTKLAGENLCYLYYSNYHFPVISLRYFTVYGPRQRPDMAIHRFVRAILNGDEIIVYGDGYQTRDFTYVDDVVEAMVMAVNSNVNGEVLNVGSGSRVSVNELIGRIEKITKNKAIVTYVETQKGDDKDTLADIRKAREILDWEPQVKINEGLKHYIAWFEAIVKG